MPARRSVPVTLCGAAAIAFVVALLGAPAPAAPPRQSPAASEIGAPAARKALELPAKIGSWTLAGPPRRFDSEGLFDYMNGAAELYVGYRFDYLDAYEYSGPDVDQILVELYWMKSSDDAFGLLSNDWTGEPLVFDDPPAGDGAAPSFPRALYASGQVRVWSDNLYARAIAYVESDETREALAAIGRAVGESRRDPPPPAIVTALPESSGDGFRLVTDRTSFLRSHHVLNSIHYLSSENILNLGHSTEAVLTSYHRPFAEGGENETELLLFVRYATAPSAREALHRFLEAVEPEETAADAADRGSLRTRDGWTGYGLQGRDLAFVLGSPATENARLLIDKVHQQAGVHKPLAPR